MLFFNNYAAKRFPYELGSKVKVKYFSIWSLHQGKKTSSNEVVSVFVFEASRFKSKHLFNIAKSVIKRIKTVRYPSILRYLYSLETDDFIYLVVEPVEPLELHLSKVEKNNEQKWFALSWGLYQIASAVAFMNKDCHLTHHNVCKSSVFVDRAGEWKLFGFECITPSKDTLPIHVFCTLLDYYPIRFDFRKSTYKNIPSWIYDSWGLGHLIWQIFNNEELSVISQLQTPGKIPSSLVNDYFELVRVDQKSRTCPSTFLKRASEGIDFFKNKFVDAMLFFREIHEKKKEEKCKFFNNLPSYLDTFPQETCLYRILPELIHAFEFGFADSSLLSPIFKMGNLLSEDEYENMIVPCMVKMFSYKDRTTRVKLFQHLGKLISEDEHERISPYILKIFSSEDTTTRVKLWQQVPVENDEMTSPSPSISKQNYANVWYVDWNDSWQNIECHSKYPKNTQKLQNYLTKENYPFYGKNELKVYKKRGSNIKSRTEVNGWNSSDNQDLWNSADCNKGKNELKEEKERGSKTKSLTEVNGWNSSDNQDLWNSADCNKDLESQHEKQEASRIRENCSQSLNCHQEKTTV